MRTSTPSPCSPRPKASAGGNCARDSDAAARRVHEDRLGRLSAAARARYADVLERLVVTSLPLALEDLLTRERSRRGPVPDLGLLNAAPRTRPQVELYGEQAYPDLDTKAAVLLESVVRDHALVDGDKRLGWLATVVFYGLNDVTLDAPDDDAYELVMAVARSEPQVEDIAAALSRWH